MLLEGWDDGYVILSSKRDTYLGAHTNELRSLCYLLLAL